MQKNENFLSKGILLCYCKFLQPFYILAIFRLTFQRLLRGGKTIFFRSGISLTKGMHFQIYIALRYFEWQKTIDILVYRRKKPREGVGGGYTAPTPNWLRG